MQVLERIDRAKIDELRAREEYFWLDVVDPAPSDVEELGDLFGLHPMAAHDLVRGGQRPKLDEYGDYVLLVYYGALPRPGGDAELVEVECIISGDYIVTVHHGRLPELAQLRDYFGQRSRGSEQFVVYRVLDALTDTFFPILAAMDDEIDELENEVMAQPTDAQLQRISGLKRTLISLRKVITPQRDLFARAGDDIIDLPGLEPDARNYFRDVYDHLIRISDLIDSYRDLLTGTMDVYLSTVSNRLNVVMKQLTVIATVFLPLSFITGFFGQNFGWLVGHIHSLWVFLVYGIGLLVVSCLALFAWFRRSGFLAS